MDDATQRRISDLEAKVVEFESKVAENLTAVARSTFRNPGFYNTFVLAIEEHPSLADDLDKRRELLDVLG